MKEKIIKNLTELVILYLVLISILFIAAFVPVLLNGVFNTSECNMNPIYLLELKKILLSGLWVIPIHFLFPYQGKVATTIVKYISKIPMTFSKVVLVIILLLFLASVITKIFFENLCETIL